MGASAAQLAIGFEVHSTGENLDQRWARFTAEHPQTIKALVWIARAKVAADIKDGRTPRVGAKGLLERLRWRDFKDDAPEYVITALSCDNSFASRVARTLAATYPDLKTVFEMRELDS